jgi:imidazolonepropionase
MNNLVIRGISKIYSPTERFGEFKEYRNCSIVVEDGVIKEIVESDIEINALLLEKYEVLDARGKVLIPGFVDSHTHPVFANTREDEFEMRNQGKTYLEIAKSGGGIKNSVKKLREIPEDKLFALSRKRVSKFLEYGTTTIEGKSGYGLTLKDELKMLRVLKRLNDSMDLDIHSTFLGAHDIPEEYKDDRKAYIDLMVDEMLPKVKEEGLATACDIFIEENYYTIEEGRYLLEKAKGMGFDIHIHADQLTNNNGSILAGELNALSAAHLDFISDEGIESMIKGDTVFTLLPGATFFIKVKNYAPAKKIIEAGGTVAIATNFNPGSCYSVSMPLMMSIGAIEMGMSADQLVWGSTRGGAKALKLDSTIGSVEVGKNADLILLDIKTLKDIPYMMGINPVKHVVKNGKVVI